MPPPFPPADSAAIILETALGNRYGNCLLVASITLVIHDYLISLHQETSLFWSGAVSFSQVLYLCLRYLSILQALMGALSLIAETTSIVYVTIPFAFILNILLAAVSQAVITLRVWYLFKTKRSIQVFAIISYVACTTGSAFILAMMSPGIVYVAVGRAIEGEIASPPGMWRLYVPSLAHHTAIFVLTLWKMRTIDSPQKSSLRRLSQEGCFIYVVALVGLAIETNYLSKTQFDQLYLPMAILQGPLPIALISVVTCRTMINLRSLADTFDIDPSWLLNIAELSRVRCHQERRGEIVVEMDPMNYSLASNEDDAEEVSHCTH